MNILWTHSTRRESGVQLRPAGRAYLLLDVAEVTVSDEIGLAERSVGRVEQPRVLSFYNSRYQQ